MALHHHSTTWQYKHGSTNMTIQHDSTPWQYIMAVHHGSTSWQYIMAVHQGMGLLNNDKYLWHTRDAPHGRAILVFGRGFGFCLLCSTRNAPIERQLNPPLTLNPKPQPTIMEKPATVVLLLLFG
jgi:hypothetical protein